MASGSPTFTLCGSVAKTRVEADECYNKNELESSNPANTNTGRAHEYADGVSSTSAEPAVVDFAERNWYLDVNPWHMCTDRLSTDRFACIDPVGSRPAAGNADDVPSLSIVSYTDIALSFCTNNDVYRHCLHSTMNVRGVKRVSLDSACASQHGDDGVSACKRHKAENLVSRSGGGFTAKNGPKTDSVMTRSRNYHVRTRRKGRSGLVSFNISIITNDTHRCGNVHNDLNTKPLNSEGAHPVQKLDGGGVSKGNDFDEYNQPITTVADSFDEQVEEGTLYIFADCIFKDLLQNRRRVPNEKSKKNSIYVADSSLQEHGSTSRNDTRQPSPSRVITRKMVHPAPAGDTEITCQQLDGPGAHVDGTADSGKTPDETSSASNYWEDRHAFKRLDDNSDTDSWPSNTVVLSDYYLFPDNGSEDTDYTSPRSRTECFHRKSMRTQRNSDAQTGNLDNGWSHLGANAELQHPRNVSSHDVSKSHIPRHLCPVSQKGELDIGNLHQEGTELSHHPGYFSSQGVSKSQIPRSKDVSAGEFETWKRDMNPAVGYNYNWNAKQSRQSKMRRRMKKMRQKGVVAGLMTCMKSVCVYMVSTLGLCTFVAVYCAFGSWLFVELEKSAENATKFEVAINMSETLKSMWKMTFDLTKYKNTTTLTEYENTWLLRSVGMMDKLTANMSDAVGNLKWDPSGNFKWTYSGSLLFAVTVVTTIGYGNIAPVTQEGRIVCMLYGLFGIPITLLCLANIGELMAKFFKVFYAKILCRCCVNQKHDTHVPVFVCLILVAGYLSMGAVLFNQWEGWSYLDAFYFCFVTLTTMGFGDMVPGISNDEASNGKRVACVAYLLIGMALLAMCFDLINEECRQICFCLGECCGIIKSDKGRARPRKGSQEDAHCLDKGISNFDLMGLSDSAKKVLQTRIASMKLNEAKISNVKSFTGSR